MTRRLTTPILLLMLGQAASALATSLHITVTDQHGATVPDAVVSLLPLTGRVTSREAGNAVLDQRGLAFVPQVLAVAVGTRVRFPNSDAVRHHVYSFSEARRFEMKLYSHQTTPTIVFDKPGLVTLGCNIHDWMRGYVYVLDEPWFSVTDPLGTATLDTPPGNYTLVARHPRQKIPAREPVTIDSTQDGNITITIFIETRGALPGQQQPAGGFVY